jgi:hypothetical protein
MIDYNKIFEQVSGKYKDKRFLYKKIPFINFESKKILDINFIDDLNFGKDCFLVSSESIEDLDEQFNFFLESSLRICFFIIKFNNKKTSKDLNKYFKKIQNNIKTLNFFSNEQFCFFIAKKREFKELIFPNNDCHFNRKTDRYQYHVYSKSFQYIKTFNTAIDVGGHIGFYSRAMSENFDRVISFEPNPENYKCLAQNCPDVDAYNCALGDTNTYASLFIDNNNSGNCYITPGKDFRIKILDDYNLKNIGLK